MDAAYKLGLALNPNIRISTLKLVHAEHHDSVGDGDPEGRVAVAHVDYINGNSPRVDQPIRRKIKC